MNATHDHPWWNDSVANIAIGCATVVLCLLIGLVALSLYWRHVYGMAALKFDQAKRDAERRA